MSRSAWICPLAVAGLAALAGGCRGDNLSDEPTGLVPVGPGTIESTIRQVVRTPEGRVYIAAIDDDGFRRRSDAEGPATSRLIMYRANRDGVPTSFRPVGRPISIPSDHTMSGGDARLDDEGTIHVAYYRTDTAQAVYQPFSTRRGAWGQAELVTTVLTRLGDNAYGRRGQVLTALALNVQGQPYFAVASDESVRVYRRGGQGRWALDGELDRAKRSLHPSMTFDRAARLHVAWLNEAPDPEIRYAVRLPDRGWRPTRTAVGGDVQSNENSDQGPALAVNADDEAVIVYLNGAPGTPVSFVRVITRGSRGWVPDHPKPNVFAHTPGIYVRGSQKFVLLGHDIDIHPAYITHRRDEPRWTRPYKLAVPAGPPEYAYDGSASARFDPLRDTNPRCLDAVFFDEDSDERDGFRPDAYYAAIGLGELPEQACG